MDIDPSGTGQTAARLGQEAEANLLRSIEMQQRSRKSGHGGKDGGKQATRQTAHDVVHQH